METVEIYCNEISRRLDDKDDKATASKKGGEERESDEIRMSRLP